MKQNGRTKALLDDFYRQGIPSIDCVVFHRGECVFRYQLGYSDYEKHRPVDGSERYNIYSCSKLITCVAALQLLEKGCYQLETPLYEILPEFKNMLVRTEENGEQKLIPAQSHITLRQLFNMTAGLTYTTNTENILRGIKETNGVMPTRKAMEYLAQDPLAFHPGSNWNYSLCHDVLAAVVEVVSGVTFGEYVKQNIFQPAGMTRSTFRLPEAELPQIAAQYRYNNDTKEFENCGLAVSAAYKWGSQYESGGAGCVSTVDDYASFLEHLRMGALLEPNTIAEMTRPQIDEMCHESFWFPNYSYGLGVRCPRPGQRTRDYGWGGAAGAFLAIFPQDEISIFYAQHVIASPIQPQRVRLTQTVLNDLEIV